MYSGLNTWYHSMAVSLKQQMKYGFQVLANYTWAKTEDGGQVSGVNGTFSASDTLLDPFNINEKYVNPNINMTREQARSDIDMRGRFVASVIYTSKTHFGHYIDYASSGWTVAGTYTGQTGFPVTAFTSNTAPSGLYTLGGGGTATAAPFDGGATGGANDSFNDGNATTARAPQVKRNGFPGPGVHNLDMRVARDFDLTHGVRFQVLAEAFNLVNHRNGLGVATTGFTFVAPSGSAANCPASHTNTCIAPDITTPPFGSINSTTGTIYGPRTLQFAAKLFF
jgi:hypothetical protein